MHKRTIILIVVLGVVAVGLLVVAILSRQKAKTTPNVSVPILTDAPKTASLYFNPDPLTVKRSASASSTTVQVMVDSGKNSISGIQLELIFDPTAFLSFEFIPAVDSIMGKLDRDYSVILNSVNLSAGSGSFQAGIIPANITLRNGVGAAATIKFQINPSFNGKSTPLTFIKNKTIVTQRNIKNSVLDSLQPLIINIE